MAKMFRTSKGGYYQGMSSKKYWTQRSKERLAESFARGEEAEVYLIDLYRKNLDKFTTEYKELVAPYVLEDGALDGVAFRRAMRTDKQFRSKYNRTASQVREFAKALGPITENKVAGLLVDEYRRTLVGTMGDLGARPAFNLLAAEAIRKAVYTPFTKDGREFSDRIWDNLDTMQKTIRSELANSIARGDSIDKTVRRFRDIYGNSAYNTQRLIRTETLATYAKASKAAYAEAGLEYLEVLAEGDACNVCQEEDNRLVLVEEAQEGVNIPPFHPNCRCCVIPVIPKQ